MSTTTTTSTMSATETLPFTPLWIDGKNGPRDPQRTFEVLSSAKGKAVGVAQGATARMAELAAESAANAFKTWKKSTPAARQKILQRVVDLFEQRKAELIAAQMEETSCAESWAEFNVSMVRGQIAEIAGRVTSACTGEIPPMQEFGTVGFIFMESMGSILLIAPWNGSVALAARSIASILAAGCTVVLKASELCPRTHHLIAQLFTEAGTPAGVINIVQARREDGPAVTEALIAHPAIRKVEFIGSAAVGRAIGSLCGKYLKPILMELGGKGASIVLEDADLEMAATRTAASTLVHHGQVCFSTDRIVVKRKVADQFIQLLKQKMLNFPQLRAVNSRMAQASLNLLVDAQDKGAKFLLGRADRVDETTLAPALVTDVTKSMAIAHEEIFGPSAIVIVVDSDEELITTVNDTAYGLDALLHSKDMQRAMEIGRQLEVGRVRVNGLAHEPTFPSSPVKGSGWGSNNSQAGIEQFLLKKVITMHMN